MILELKEPRQLAFQKMKMKDYKNCSAQSARERQTTNEIYGSTIHISTESIEKFSKLKVKGAESEFLDSIVEVALTGSCVREEKFDHPKFDRYLDDMIGGGFSIHYDLSTVLNRIGGQILFFVKQKDQSRRFYEPLFKDSSHEAEWPPSIVGIHFLNQIGIGLNVHPKLIVNVFFRAMDVDFLKIDTVYFCRIFQHTTDLIRHFMDFAGVELYFNIANLYRGI